MEIDMRSVSPARLDGVDALLHQAVDRALEEANGVRRQGDALTVDVTLIGNRPSGAMDDDHPFVLRAMAATDAVGGIPSLSRSSTDSNVPIALGIPAVTIGGGGVGVGAHSLHEFFINHNGPAGVKRALLLVLAQAQISAPVS